MTPVRVYWADGCLAFPWRRHDATGWARAGRGAWTPLSAGEEVCADSGAARFVGASDELVALLRDPPGPGGPCP